MLIKKIATLCRASKSLRVYHTGAHQMVGDKLATYAVDNLPRMSATEWATLLELPGSANEWDIDFNYKVSWAGVRADIYDYDETPVSDYSFAFKAGGGEKRLFVDEMRRVFLVENAYLAPLKGMQGEWYTRELDGAWWLAFKQGMDLQAVIAADTPPEVLMKDLRNLVQAWEYTLAEAAEKDDAPAEDRAEGGSQPAIEEEAQ